MTPPERGRGFGTGGTFLKSPRFLSKQRGPSQWDALGIPSIGALVNRISQAAA